MLMLVLSLLVTNGSSKERGCKWSTFWSAGPGWFEIIFTLLTKVIAIHMRFAQVYVWGPGFKKFFSNSA